MRNLFLLLTFSAAINASAQQNYYVDMCTNSTSKAFSAMSLDNADIWTLKEHNCAGNLTNNPAMKEVQDVAKHSQSHLEAMAKGGVRLSNQILTTTEAQILKSKAFQDDAGLAAITCITGMQVSKLALMQNDFDYFRIILAQVRYLKLKEGEKHYIGSKAYKYSIIRSAKDMDGILADPTTLGMTLSLKGGHLLGSFLPINTKMTNTPEYQAAVLRNVDRLKGITPIEDNTNDYLDFPILSLSFDSYFGDGLCGKSRIFTQNQEKLFGAQTDVEAGVSPLGEKVIKRLVSNREGRRILIDVSNMSLEGRKWYYEYLKGMRELGDTIPVLASHISVNGLNWNDEAYLSEDKPEKNNKSWFNTYKSALSRQDILEIYKSNGLFGIALEKSKLMHDTRFQQEVNKTVAGSLQRRELMIKVLVAQMCKIVHIIQRPEAWDMICIGSEFDDVAQSFESYQTSADIKDLAADLRKFFSAPTDIFDLYTVKDIKTYMMGYSADDLVKKIMTDNATNFMRRTLNNLESKSAETANGGK